MVGRSLMNALKRTDVGDVCLYQAIEKTANQNTEKPWCIGWYYTQASHQAPRVRRINYVGHCIFLRHLTLSRGVP